MKGDPVSFDKIGMMDFCYREIEDGEWAGGPCPYRNTIYWVEFDSQKVPQRITVFYENGIRGHSIPITEAERRFWKTNKI